MKLSADIIAKIKEIEIQTSRLVSGTLIGDKQSAMKGVGFEFDQIRDYCLGDDVRTIDWKSSARTGSLLVKQYIEEHNRIIMLLIDGSSSGLCSSRGSYSKYEVMARIGTIIALVAQRAKDQIGLILFTDRVEYYIPPKAGRSHIQDIINIIWSWQPRYGHKTSIHSALERLIQARLMASTICIISDFITGSFETILAAVTKRHEMIAIRCLDALERSFVNIGYIQTVDIETGRALLIDARARNKKLADELQRAKEDTIKICKKHHIDVLDIDSSRPFMGELIRFFRRRMYT